MNLAGLHDHHATTAAPPDTWIVDTIALSENPAPKHYPSALNLIIRLNYGYGRTGTLPQTRFYADFAHQVADYVKASRGCKRWQIGNEPNLAREWPDGVPIYPWDYALCFKMCRQAIRALPGHGQDEVLIAASGPWNDECKYDGNKNGDWITYFGDTINVCDGQFDGFSIHAYTHGYDVNLVTGDTRMNAPFQNRQYNFRTYQDYCDAIPGAFLDMPAYITEANGDGPWQAVGLIPAMLQEIDYWNNSNNKPLIHSVVFYRYSNEDENARFEMGNKPDVMAEYYGGVQLGLMSPIQSPIPEPPDPQPPTPEPPDPTPEPPAPEPPAISWDARLTVRGCELTVAEVSQGQTVWVCTMGKWFNEQEAQGRVNTYVTLLDENGQLVIGVPADWYWGSGKETKTSERKYDPWLGHDYSFDFAMYNVAPSYGVVIADGNPSDDVWGMGLGSIEQPDYKIHTAYSFTFQRVKAQMPGPPDPGPSTTKYVTALAGANLRTEPVTGAILVAVPYGEAVSVYGSVSGDDGYQWDACTYLEHDGFIRSDLLSVTKPQPPEPPDPGRGHLIWPVRNARITQRFGDRYEYYQAHYDAAGHNGLDFGLAAGSPILAVASGIVTMAGDDTLGYGLYVRLYHPSLRLGSLYAHCNELLVNEGDRVTQGQQIATVGSTGNSTGAHCHWELCAQDESGYVNVSYGHTKGRANPEVVMWMIGKPPVYR